MLKGYRSNRRLLKSTRLVFGSTELTWDVGKDILVRCSTNRALPAHTLRHVERVVVFGGIVSTDEQV